MEDDLLMLLIIVMLKMLDHMSKINLKHNPGNAFKNHMRIWHEKLNFAKQTLRQLYKGINDEYMKVCMLYK